MILRISLIIVLIGIAYASLTPSEIITVGNDKISHFIAYSILMFNTGLVFFKSKKMFFRSIILCIIYGAVIEAAQDFIPGRYMSLNDFFANTLGVVIGVLLTFLLYNPAIKILQKARII